MGLVKMKLTTTADFREWVFSDISDEHEFVNRNWWQAFSNRGFRLKFPFLWTNLGVKEAIPYLIPSVICREISEGSEKAKQTVFNGKEDNCIAMLDKITLAICSGIGKKLLLWHDPKSINFFCKGLSGLWEIDLRNWGLSGELWEGMGVILLEDILYAWTWTSTTIAWYCVEAMSW